MIERLQEENVQVSAAANPLRGPSHDSAYLASLFDQIPGPVLAVGHSYAGAVISSAASIEETVTTGGSSLSYDPVTDTYTYVWKTNRAWANTCRQFVLKLSDGSFYRANFKFK